MERKRITACRLETTLVCQKESILQMHRVLSSVTLSSFRIVSIHHEFQPFQQFLPFCETG